MLTLSKPPPWRSFSPPTSDNSDWPMQSADLLTKVEHLLEGGRPQDAVSVIGDKYLSCPWTANALAVCHLRLGNNARAIHLLRYITFDQTGFEFRSDVPMVFKTNFAIALLADGNFEGFLSTLDKLAEIDHPSVQRLLATVARWKDSLTGWQTFWWNVAGLVPRLPSLDFPLGELGTPRVGLPLFEKEGGTRTDMPPPVDAAFNRLPSRSRPVSQVGLHSLTHSAQAAG
jgi:hypothetical protein